MKYRIKELFVFVMIAMVSVSCGEQKKEEEKNEVTPTPELSEQQEFIEMDVAAVQEAKKGGRIEVTNTHRDEVYTLIVRQVQKTSPGKASFSANIGDAETGLAIITIRDNKLSGTLQFYKENLQYQIGFDTVANQHFLVEMDPEETENMEGSAPLTPQY